MKRLIGQRGSGSSYRGMNDKQNNSSIRRIGESLENSDVELADEVAAQSTPKAEPEKMEESKKEESRLSDKTIKSLEQLGESLLNSAKTEKQREEILKDLNKAVAEANGDGSVAFRGNTIDKEGNATKEKRVRSYLFSGKRMEPVAIPARNDTGFQWSIPKTVHSEARHDGDSFPSMGGFKGVMLATTLFVPAGTDVVGRSENISFITAATSGQTYLNIDTINLTVSWGTHNASWWVISLHSSMVEGTIVVRFVPAYAEPT